MYGRSIALFGKVLEIQSIMWLVLQASAFFIYLEIARMNILNILKLSI